jgi:hypothetical protein
MEGIKVCGRNTCTLVKNACDVAVLLFFPDIGALIPSDGRLFLGIGKGIVPQVRS